VERLKMGAVVPAGDAAFGKLGQRECGDVRLDAGELVGVADAAGVPQDAGARVDVGVIERVGHLVHLSSSGCLPAPGSASRIHP
jgi:hypothetical protein